MGILFEVVGVLQENQVGFMYKQHTPMIDNQVFSILRLPTGNVKTIHKSTLGQPIRSTNLESGRVQVCQGFCQEGQLPTLQQRIESILMPAPMPVPQVN
ncbi:MULTISPECIES: hypothetical protein [Paenibacillus]|uniref:hypothetical protein n=1 Tax=Paenibacillus TaxID=44249 RepID=UPI0022B931B1|nr:hypothetical protein [Paenibacillus caseinilyticus]MCZ8520427.1 hypothetical protein [Paenibacillus caseinilyticus]